MSGTSRVCRACGKTKDLDAFHEHPHGLLGCRSQCKDCKNAKARIRRQKNVDKARADLRQWLKDNPERAKAIRERSRIKCQFGITLEQYNALLAEQQGVCAICKTAPAEIKLAVDHCHETLAIRGLLCMKCNTLLGFVKDSVPILQRAITYLQQERPNATKITGRALVKHRKKANDFFIEMAATGAQIL